MKVTTEHDGIVYTWNVTSYGAIIEKMEAAR